MNVEEIVATLERYNSAYRLGTPIVSDSEYDKLVDELRKEAPNHLWLSKVEPAPVQSGRKLKLPIQMKSLNKVKSIEDLMGWAKSLGLTPKTKLVITPKYDGVSWLHDEKQNVTYSRGGTENEGQDCSAHFDKGGFTQAGNLQARYTYGELVFGRSSWKENMAGKISDSTGEPYRSARNTVAGFINRDIPTPDLQYADFVRYGVDDESRSKWEHYSDLLDDMAQESKAAVYVLKPLEEITLSSLHWYFKCWSEEYYCDGLVIYIDDMNLWDIIGRQQTSGNPLYAIAYKHPAFTESYDTVVRGISWTVSKSGALKPVVQIDPVDTGDCIMENPTGYNARWCVEHELGVGAEIKVIRSGGVIPKIVETVKGVECFPPIQCPSCGAYTGFDRSDPDCTDAYCPNSKCEGRQLAKIKHFFNIMAVEEIGEEAIGKVFSAGFKSVKAFLDISGKELAAIEGFGDTTIDIFLSQMAKIKEGVSLPLLMHASDCFDGIGKAKAQKFLDGLDDEEFASFVQGWFYSGWQAKNWPAHPTFNELSVTAKNIFLGYYKFWEFVNETQIPVIVSERKAPTGNKCQGFSVCFSGVRDHALEDFIKAEGGVVVTAVSKKTTHLIVASLNVISSKTDKAQQAGVKIMTIEGFKNSI